jgi:hypothetical protein
MYQKAQQEQAAAAADGSPNGAAKASGEAEEEIVDAEVVDEGKKS